MKSEILLLKADSRNRVSLTKISKEIAKYYRAYKIDGKIILEPLTNEETEWIFKPENKRALESLKRGLKQKGTIKRGSFAKYAKD